MLHYSGDITAMELAEQARKAQLKMYAVPGATVCLVPFMDLQKGKKRYVKFEKMPGVKGWIFVDLVD